MIFYCEDAGLVARNHEAMEAARRKMQEDLDAKAVLFREKQKQVSLRADPFHQDRSGLSSGTAKNKPDMECLTRGRKRRENRSWTVCSMGRAAEEQRDKQT